MTEQPWTAAPRVKRALVLSGGGYAGEAWMLGLIHALRDQGINLCVADLIVGTSAGARVGVHVASASLDEAVRRYRSAPLAIVDPSASLQDFVAASLQIASEAADQQEAARRIANLPPLGPTLASQADRTRTISASLPVQTWPERPLDIVAVDAATGARTVFDADSGVDLLDAVLASGALPGIYPLVTIGDRRYADGGAHSLYNADLAAGHDVVVVVTPAPLNPYLTRLLDTEVAELRDAHIQLIVPNEASIDATGSNPLSAETSLAALEAGATQAQLEVNDLSASWLG
jgi:NTE family protein